MVLNLVRDTKVNIYMQTGNKTKTKENTGNCTRGMKMPRYSWSSDVPYDDKKANIAHAFKRVRKKRIKKVRSAAPHSLGM